jgi:hypothetical protein
MWFAGGLGEEFCPLFDAEAMLLVDDNKAERSELCSLSEEGVGADNQCRLPICGRSSGRSPFGDGGSTEYECNLDAEWSE